MVLFYFSLVFILNISNIYLANIFYYFLIIKQIIKDKGKIMITDNSRSLLFLFSFIMWTTVSTFTYAFIHNDINSRIIFQYLFTMQYLVMIFTFKFNIKLFEKWIYYFSVIFSIYILCINLYSAIIIPGFSIRMFKDSILAYKLIPGWPNSTPMPLLMALWMSFKYEKRWIFRILILAGLLSTTSRGAYLGILLIVSYFMYKKVKLRRRFIFIIMLSCIILFVGLNHFIKVDPFFISRITRSYDREDIFATTMSYVKLNPILGYGGNTIDQLQDIRISHVPFKNWGHTHNWVLEILLRYGMIGLILFSAFLFSVWLKIDDKDRKYMFVVLILLAVFQTFIRDFIFIFYLSYLSNNTECNKYVDKY